MSKRGDTGLMSYRTYRIILYRHRCCTDTGTNSGTKVHTCTSGTGIDVLPSFPKWHWCRTELTEVFGTGIDIVPKLTQNKCPVQVLMLYWTYRSVRYRYWCCTETYRRVRCRYESLYLYRRYRYSRRTELTKVSGTGIDVLPNSPKCMVPVLMSYRTYRSGITGGRYRRYASVRTVPNTLFFVCCSKGTL